MPACPYAALCVTCHVSYVPINSDHLVWLGQLWTHVEQAGHEAEQCWEWSHILLSFLPVLQYTQSFSLLVIFCWIFQKFVFLFLCLNYPHRVVASFLRSPSFLTNSVLSPPVGGEGTVNLFHNKLWNYTEFLNNVLGFCWLFNWRKLDVFTPWFLGKRPNGLGELLMFWLFGIMLK